MVPHNGEVIASNKQRREVSCGELQDKLEIGRHLGTGPRYLLYYYGQLAITNNTGLMYWPEGPKMIVSVIKEHECENGLSINRKEYLLAKLNSLKLSIVY